MKSSRFSKSSKRKKYFIIIFFALLFSLAFIFIKDFVRISELEVRGVLDTDIVNVSDLVSTEYKNKSYFDIDDSDIKKFIENSFPRYVFTKVVFIFPGKLVIDLKLREENYIIADFEGRLYSIDSNGFVFGVAFGNLKVDIRYDKNLEVGKTLNDEILKSALLYVDGKNEVVIQNDEISIKLDNGGKVILPTNADKSNILEISETLQKIIQKYRIENRGIEFIDMRFSKPVIKFK